jgi:hypothetical protein
MTSTAYMPYQPLGVLKAVADDVWIVDGPEIRFRLGPLRLPFPTRMTVVRLPARKIWIHSPVALHDDLIRQISDLGEVAYLIAPNTIHYWWVRDWKRHYPAAEVWAVSRLHPRARGRMPDHHHLDPEPPPAWSSAIDQVLIEGTRLMEAEFFHRPSRTLISTDLIENFERGRFRSPFYKLMSIIGGVVDPDGRAPAELRSSFRANQDQVRAAVEQMIAWGPERVIIAHGRWYAENAEAELKRAFRWIL